MKKGEASSSWDVYIVRKKGRVLMVGVTSLPRLVQGFSRKSVPGSSPSPAMVFLKRPLRLARKSVGDQRAPAI